ncbi:hypothetical protein FNH05_29465 [Amycolatopsis rhizosphaerae]|uniref:Uncharacterized protein n=1 Tax=Amycolatopsis rhizosphaerae TaxID=2053003 RepID=A0A558B0Y6_9PSEU|nr:hypothetical protein [Amycolatopsis rhizosphaerae]TVT30182.1 hypothetical protein FNH05_29465 [Amycolatopsis rhizosphaerae]
MIEPPESGELGAALFLYALVPVPWMIVGYRRRRFRRYTGEWRTVTAAVAGVDFTGGRPRFVPGWAVLPGGRPVRFLIEDCLLGLYTHTGRAGVPLPTEGHPASGSRTRGMSANCRFRLPGTFAFATDG